MLFLTEQALKKHLSRLPEPPMMRDNLKKEIKMFVEMLQQREKEEGRYEFWGRKSDNSKRFPTGLENFFNSRASPKHGDCLYKEPWTGRPFSHLTLDVDLSTS